MRNILHLTFLIFIFPLISLSQTTGSYALSFDGIDDYVGFEGNSPSYSNTMTIEAWIKTDMASSDYSNNIVCWGNSSGSVGDNVQFRMDGGKLTFGSHPNGGSWQAASSTQSININNWVHVAVVKNGNNIQLYINGVADNSATNTNSMTVDRMVIGAYFNAGTIHTGDFCFDGLIDEVRIWNDVRAAGEIREFMYKDLTTTDNLVAYYKMSNGADGLLSDNSPNGKTGTLNNGVAWAGSGCWVSPGNALNFSGSEYIDFGTNSPPYSNTTITIEAWIKTDYNSTGYPNIISWGNSSGSIGDNVQIRMDGGKLTFGSDPQTGSWQAFSSNQSINTGSWVHVAVVKDGDNVQLYINGVADNSATNTNSMNVDRMVMGSYYNQVSGDGAFQGLIDEVRIWNTARSAVKIREGMFSNYNGNWGGIEGMYRMNQKGTETVFYDGSWNGRNGTMTNFADPDASWVQSTIYNTWLGFTSGISTTSNWSTGSLPGAPNNINVTQGSPNLLSISSEPVSPFQCNCMNIKSDASLTINDGKALTVNGELYNTGTLSIKSTISGTGSLIVAGTSSGNITVQRFLTEGKWHYISAPVNDTRVFNTFLDLTGGENNDQFYWWDEDGTDNGSTGIWFDILNDPTGISYTANSFLPSQGYAITYAGTGSETISFSGVPYTENKTITITNTPASSNPGANLVGNPFCSTIAITKDAQTTNNFIDQNSLVLRDNAQAVYFWDERQDDYETKNNGSGAIYADPGQGFMVLGKSENASASLEFNVSTRKHGTASFYKSGEEDQVQRVKLFVSGAENLSNSTEIVFLPEMTTGLDPSYDAAKLKGNPNIALYTRLLEDNGEDFAIQALPDNDIENFVIPIGVDVAETGVFEFSVYQEQLENHNIVLEDRQENTFTDLRWETYFATISEGGTGRFYLHFKDATAIGEIIPETKISFNVLDGKITIHNPDKEKGTISLVNISGQVLGKYKMNGNDRQEFSINQAKGIYIINIQTEKAAISRKVFLK